MTEMPPLFYPPGVESQPHNPTVDVQPCKFLLPVVAAGSRCYDYFDSSK